MTHSAPADHRLVQHSRPSLRSTSTPGRNAAQRQTTSDAACAAGAPAAFTSPSSIRGPDVQRLPEGCRPSTDPFPPLSLLLRVAPLQMRKRHCLRECSGPLIESCSPRTASAPIASSQERSDCRKAIAPSRVRLSGRRNSLVGESSRRLGLIMGRTLEPPPAESRNLPGPGLSWHCRRSSALADRDERTTARFVVKRTRLRPLISSPCHRPVPRSHRTPAAHTGSLKAARGQRPRQPSSPDRRTNGM